MYRTVLTIVSLTLVMGWANAAAEKVDVAPAPIVEESRFVTMTNGTNIQVSAISVIGATLIGIAIALAVGGLLPVFSGALGTGGQFGKRSIPDGEDDWFGAGPNPFSFLRLMSMVDGVKDFNVADVDCQKKMVCELHRQGVSIAGRNMGTLSDKIFDVFNYINPGEEDDETSLLSQFLDAAKKGKTKQDCEHIYSSCQYSVRKVIRSLRDNAE